MNPTAFERYRNHVLAVIDRQRFALIASGVLISLLGLAAILIPLTVLKSFLWLVGFLFAAAGAVTLAQWVVGRWRRGPEVRGSVLALWQAAALLLIGGLLILRHTASLWLGTFVLGAALLLDGVPQLLLAFRARTWGSRIALAASGLVSLGVALFVFLSGLDVTAAGWPLAVLGIKLLVFGLVLITIAATTRGTGADLVYGSPPSVAVAPQVGEAYAVFVGYCFHLGVYVGDDQVVDYLQDNHVRLVSWQEFLLGRVPQHWEYPDLERGGPEQIAAFAREEVGKSYPYNFFTFNCESFAIRCMTIGRTQQSAYSQIAIGVENVEFHPLVGSLMEMYSRGAEYVVFHLGGFFGQRASLKLRGLSALVAKWLLAQRLTRRLKRTQRDDARNRQPPRQLPD